MLNFENMKGYQFNGDDPQNPTSVTLETGEFPRPPLFFKIEIRICVPPFFCFVWRERDGSALTTSIKLVKLELSFAQGKPKNEAGESRTLCPLPHQQRAPFFILFGVKETGRGTRTL